MTGRVLIVGNFLSSTGLSRGVCESLAERLSAAGWQVLTTSSQIGRLRRLLDMVGTVWRKRHSYDVAQVDVYGGKAFLWAELVCFALRVFKKPYVLTLHGGSLPEFAQRWPIRVRRLIRSGVFVTSPSRFQCEQLRPLRSDIVVIPNGLDIDRYEFSLLRNPRPRLVWLRAFHRMYNPSLAPRVVSRLASEFPGLHLTMIGPDKGDGSLRETQAAAAAENVNARISFPGPIPKADVGAWLNRSDVFLNTTDVDNAPVTLLEAMACGLCVVSTRVGGIPYLVKDGEEALLVPADDVEAMASAVRRVLRDSELAKTLSRGGRCLAEQHDWSLVLPKWLEILTAAANADRRSNQSPQSFIDVKAGIAGKAHEAGGDR